MIPTASSHSRVRGRGGCPKFLYSSEFIPYRCVRFFGTFFVQFFVLFDFHRCDVVQPPRKRKRTLHSVVGVLVVPQFNRVGLDLGTFFGRVCSKGRFFRVFRKYPPRGTGCDHEKQRGRNRFVNINEENGCRGQRAKRDDDIQPKLYPFCWSLPVARSIVSTDQRQGW